MSKNADRGFGQPHHGHDSDVDMIQKPFAIALATKEFQDDPAISIGHSVKFLGKGIIEVDGWRYKSVDDNLTIDHDEILMCSECDEISVHLYDDPRPFPLVKGPCLCKDCYKIALDDIIEEAENNAEYFRKMRDNFDRITK